MGRKLSTGGKRPKTDKRHLSPKLYTLSTGILQKCRNKITLAIRKCVLCKTHKNEFFVEKSYFFIDTRDVKKMEKISEIVAKSL